MIKILEYIMVFLAAFICVMVLMQDSAIDNNLISAFSNKRLTLFSSSKERGSAKVLMWVTYIAVFAFMTLAFVVMFLSRKAG